MDTLIKHSNSQPKVSDISTKVAVAYGDGIGPEIMQSTIRILNAARANVDFHPIKLGRQVYLDGNTSGIDSSAWQTIDDCRILLKAPITTPQGKGYKSLNVTLRKSLGLFANVRPVRSMEPYVSTVHSNMDVVIIRENEEDLYAGIEHQQTQDVVQCLKLITRPGCEKIIRYAFEYAKMHKRKKVTCMVKDNIMKLTDGLFHKVFDELSVEYPEIVSQTEIIDIGAAKLASYPERYDVVVTSNLYGDILSDIVAESSGSVGLAGSANVGSNVAMFEAIHGSAPDIADQNIANPTGLINAAVMMLIHIGQLDVAKKIKNALLRTIEDGIHTADIYQEGWSKKRVGTQDFTQAIIERLGQSPRHLKALNLKNEGKISIPKYKRPTEQKKLVGIDVFLDWQGDDATLIGDKLTQLTNVNSRLKMITNRGVKVYPKGNKFTYCTDHWRCRFLPKNDDTKYTHIDILELLQALYEGGFDVVKTENLYHFDGLRGFSLGQGE